MYFLRTSFRCAEFFLALANSTKLCYTYDSLSRVTARTAKKLSDNSVVSTKNFNYDAAGNVTSAPDSSFQYRLLLMDLSIVNFIPNYFFEELFGGKMHEKNKFEFI